MFDGVDSTNLVLASAAGLLGLILFLLLGRRADGSKATSKAEKGPEKTSGRLVALNPEQKIPFKLIDKEIITSDTRKFRFELQTPEHILGLPIGQHMYLSAKINGSTVVRPYTPVSSDDEVGYFDLVIKVYKAGVHPKFPEGGKMSQYLDGLSIGDTIDVRGPNGKLTYRGRGNVSIKEGKNKEEEQRHCTKIGMMAGGTGITPMLQIVRAILKDPEDHTEMWLLFANQTEDDILLRAELEEVAEKHKDRFHLWYTVDRPPQVWSFSSGFISEEMVAKHMPPPSADTQIFMCGPPPMIKFACIPNLEKLNYDSSMWFVF